MNSTSRRNFLKSLGATTGSAVAMSMLPPTIREALAIPAHDATRSIQDVEHVVILMQENRSFDHYFGTMAGVRGFGDRLTIPLPNERSVFEQSNGERVVMPYHLDQRTGNAQRVSGTHHDWGDAQAAWDHGRMTEWPRHKTNPSMGYYKQRELPFQFALANAFTICDAYHCSLHGGTNTNRMYHWTGTNGASNGIAVVTNEWDTFWPPWFGYTWTTYPERLQEAGVSWKVYQNLPNNFTNNPLHGFTAYRSAHLAVNSINSVDSIDSIDDVILPLLWALNPVGLNSRPWEEAHEQTEPLYKGCSNTMPDGGYLEAFRADVAAGKLPQVSWIVAPMAYSEHPDPSSPVQGAWYIQEVLAALVAQPEVWNRTALIINFDENDGFFDHMPPPSVYSHHPDGSPAGGSTLDASELAAEWFTHPSPPFTSGQPVSDGRPYGPGPRVPCYVVSPWSRGGWVCSQVFDHTSVLQFLERRFGVKEPNISSYRRAICGDLTSAFNFANPNADVPPLPACIRTEADGLRQAQEQLPQVSVPEESEQQLPHQKAGLRRSRALPYELHVDTIVKPAESAIELLFRNTGTAGAVFHVYDRLHLDRIPHRYSVEAGNELYGSWTLAEDAGAYDLWVLGPNGFHRHIVGTVITDVAIQPEVTATYDTRQGQLKLHLFNMGTEPCTFLAKANAYEAWTARETVSAGEQITIQRPLKQHANWYDITVAVEDAGLFTRRFAGRVETGLDGVSDPAFVLGV